VKRLLREIPRGVIASTKRPEYSGKKRSAIVAMTMLIATRTASLHSRFQYPYRNRRTSDIAFVLRRPSINSVTKLPEMGSEQELRKLPDFRRTLPADTGNWKRLRLSLEGFGLQAVDPLEYA
jgi:hypothetical protein